jgi:hypothetical protein
MFKWLQPKCPIDPELKQWIETRMAWLAREFGIEQLWDAEVILPTEQYFPDRLDGSEHSLRQLLDQVCKYMRVPSDRVTLRLYSEDRHVDLAPGFVIQSDKGGSAGMYSADTKEIISIETSGNPDPMSLVATMAHELAHVHLLGDERLSAEEEDHEHVTDLTTVFFGMGIFNANTTVQSEQWSSGGWSGWQTSTQGYLDEPSFAYAHALFAWLRSEHRPEWDRHLTPTIRSLFRKGLKYLCATGDSTFHAVKGGA